MPDQEQWRVLIEEALKNRPSPVKAVTYLNDKHGSYSKPFKVTADGEDYYVKALREDKDLGRALCVEQVAGYLGEELGAPVPPTPRVKLTEEFVQAEPELTNVKPGLAHGVQDIGECSPKRTDVAYVDVDTNRERFARLAVLYGWFHGHDEQVLYRTQSPELVFSVDHGHFLPAVNGQQDNWSVDCLMSAPDPEPYPKFVNGASLGEDELHRVYEDLAEITDRDISEGVARPPQEWGIVIEERVALADYLAERRDTLTATAAGEEDTNG